MLQSGTPQARNDNPFVHELLELSAVTGQIVCKTALKDGSWSYTPPTLCDSGSLSVLSTFCPLGCHGGGRGALILPVQGCLVINL